MNLKKKEIEFLIGLEKLTRETGIEIAGCGCCGSPFMMKLSSAELVKEAGYAYEAGDSEISWLSPEESDWDLHKDKIVK